MNQEQTELQWLAFQYIAGELPDDDLAEFEARLASDQVARETVAHAVELAEITALAENRSGGELTVQPASMSKGTWSQVAWMACGAALCLLVVLFVQPMGLFGLASITDPNNSSGESRLESPELALAWAQTRDSVHVEESVDLAEVAVANDSENLTDEGISTPSWMLAAVVGLTGSVEEIE
jgi:anti-sigma factor RsiW